MLVSGIFLNGGNFQLFCSFEELLLLAVYKNLKITNASIIEYNLELSIA